MSIILAIVSKSFYFVIVSGWLKKNIFLIIFKGTHQIVYQNKITETYDEFYIRKIWMYNGSNMVKCTIKSTLLLKFIISFFSRNGLLRPRENQ